MKISSNRLTPISPEKTESSERFVVPEAKAYVEGKTTVLENFSEIASKVRRDRNI